MHGGVTGKAGDSLPMSIQPRVRAPREPWVESSNFAVTLKGFANCRALSGFDHFRHPYPKVVASLQPWAEISERLSALCERLSALCERLSALCERLQRCAIAVSAVRTPSV